MTKILIAIICSCYLIANSASVYGKEEKYKTLSEDSAARSFNYFATCMARKYEKYALNWIVATNWKAAYAEIVIKAKNSRCVRNPVNSRITADELLIKGGLAEGLYEKDLRKSKLEPSFIGLPYITTKKMFEDAKSPADKGRLLISIFAECTVRNAPLKTRSLFKSKPASDKEKTAFARLSDVMSSCMPAEEGQSVRFTKYELRSRLSIASFLLYRQQLVSVASENNNLGLSQ